MTRIIPALILLALAAGPARAVNRDFLPGESGAVLTAVHGADEARGFASGDGVLLGCSWEGRLALVYDRRDLARDSGTAWSFACEIAVVRAPGLILETGLGMGRRFAREDVHRYLPCRVSLPLTTTRSVRVVAFVTAIVAPGNLSPLEGDAGVDVRLFRVLLLAAEYDLNEDPLVLDHAALRGGVAIGF